MDELNEKEEIREEIIEIIKRMEDVNILNYILIIVDDIEKEEKGR